MKIKNIKKTLFIFLVASFLVLVIVPGTMAIFSEKANTKINLNVESPTFTVTFDANGGTASIGSKDVPYAHQYGELPDAEKCGSTFLGWYTGLADGVKIEESTIFDIMDEQTLYAKYESNKKLYDELECRNENYDLVIEYGGNHQDSIDESKSTKNIYYWDIFSNSDADEVNDSNNVIFAEHCWKIMRTTDTGGVKLIYNGEAVDNKCLSNRGNHEGYSYSTNINLSGTYVYGTDYEYDDSNVTFKVSGTTETKNITVSNGIDVIPNLIGKYTCKQSSIDDTCSTIYLIESFKENSEATVIKLENNSHYSQFGQLQYSAKSDSLAYVGYMHNKIYEFKNGSMGYSKTILSDNTFFSARTYYYSNEIEWDEETSSYILVNPVLISSTDIENTIGKYSYFSDNLNLKRSYINYVEGGEDITITTVTLRDGNDFDIYTYGDSYTPNADGTFTINEPETISTQNWYNNYSDIKDKYACKNAVNNICRDLLIIRSSSRQQIRGYKVETFANSFTYDGNKYILTNKVVIDNMNDSTTRGLINTHHYTCFGNLSECENLAFVYGYDYIDGPNWYYINLSNGENITDALNTMLNSENVNVNSSRAKFGVEAWYKHNLLEYDQYIEDTVFCNNRIIKNPTNNRFTQNGNVSSELYFKSEDNYFYDLKCENVTDRFSVSNDKAKLNYKVGLISSVEIKLLNENNQNVVNTGNQYWTMSPLGTERDYSPMVFNLYSGYLSEGYINNNYGIRPSISLIPGITYVSGNGSMNNPYIIDTSGA